MEGLEPERGVSWSFSSAQGLTLPYWEQGQVPSCWSRIPEGPASSGAVPSMWMFYLCQHSHPCSQRGAVLEQVGQIQAPSMGLGTGCGVLATVRVLDCF